MRAFEISTMLHSSEIVSVFELMMISHGLRIQRSQIEDIALCLARQGLQGIAINYADIDRLRKTTRGTTKSTLVRSGECIAFLCLFLWYHLCVAADRDGAALGRSRMAHLSHCGNEYCTRLDLEVRLN